MHASMKLAAGAIGTIGAIIGGYLAVEAWAGDRFVQIDAAVMEAAKNEVVHNQQFIQRKLEYNETMAKIAELELRQIEAEIDGEEQSRAQERQVKRLEKKIAFHDSQVEEARAALAAPAKMDTASTAETVISDEEE